MKARRMPSPRALEIAQLSAPDASALSIKLIADQIDIAIAEAVREATEPLVEALQKYGDKKNYDGFYASGTRLTGNMEVRQGVFVAKPWDLATTTLAAHRAREGR